MNSNTSKYVKNSLKLYFYTNSTSRVRRMWVRLVRHLNYYAVTGRAEGGGERRRVL